MAARKVFLNSENSLVREVRQTEVKKLKEAFKVVVRDYLRMKQQQSKFEDSLEKFCLKISPWSIPHRTVQTWVKDLRRR